MCSCAHTHTYVYVCISVCVCVCVYVSVYTHSAVQKFGISKAFNVFNGVSYAHQCGIYLIKNTENCNTVK